MRTIIAGSRNCKDYNILLQALKSCPWQPTVILSGTAAGADRLGEKFAMENNLHIEKYPANWNKFGKSAGYIRNTEMAKNAEALIALWDMKSKGTGHMIGIARKHNLIICIYNFKIYEGMK